MPRVFEIVTDVFHPRTGDLILDRDKIESVLQAHKTIKEYAYVLHDQDNYNADDEHKQRDELSRFWSDNRANLSETEDEYIKNNLTHIADKHKDDHWHIVIRFDRAQDVQTVAKWFGVPANFVAIPKGQGAFMDKVEYITHEREEQQALGKHLYSDSEIYSNFNFRSAIDNRNAMRLKYGSRANKMTEGDILQLHVMLDGWSMRRCRQEDPLTYLKVRSKLPNLRLDYLLDQPPQPFRISIYVDGAGGLGKGSICQYIAERLFPNVERPCFVVGNDPRVAFDGYDGEPVLIWEDYRAYKFIQNFTREGTFAIFDSHPKVQSQQAKNTRVVLQNYVNIVNGIESYTEFLDGLAGEYTDRDGNEHVAEDKNQVYRRFQQIICVRDDNYEVLFNRGFVDHDSYAYHQYDLYRHVSGSMSKAMQQLDGKAKEHVMIDMTQPAVDCYHMIEDSHENKITAIEDIPDEFRDYGKSYTSEELELDMLAEYYTVFYEIWISAHSEKLAKGTTKMSDIPSFEEWKEMGRPNAWNNDGANLGAGHYFRRIKEMI